MIDQEVVRGTFRQYGTAIRYLPKGKYVAWGTEGPTTGNCAIQEKGRFCVASGKTAEIALARLWNLLEAWG